jgi:tRNA uridine 5-carboxymethylaminomethyl modification enzyme
MFTSRAEFRLRLRADNADQRLTGLGVQLGLVRAPRAEVFARKAAALAAGRAMLTGMTLTPNEARRHGLMINSDGRRRSAFELLSYPSVGFEQLAGIWPALNDLQPAIADQLVADARYQNYVERQAADVDSLKRDEHIEIPSSFSFKDHPGLTIELAQKLARHRPSTLAQAAQIDGMTPAALLLLRARLKKDQRQARTGRHEARSA